VSVRIYIEGGGDSKELHVRCREGFRKLLERCGFVGHMPRLVACGSRTATFADFKIEHRKASPGDFVAMILGSEEPAADLHQTWQHLADRDKWATPENAHDDQVFLMITCMETWIVADRATLAEHFGSEFQQSALPASTGLEARSRQAIQDALAHASRSCKNAYAKGKRSFEILGKLDPATLEKHLPSFARMKKILSDRLR
jgi:hypothetical protein